MDAVFLSLRRRGLAALLVLATILAGCASSGGSPTIPVDATGRAAPPAIGTPTAPASPSPASFPVTITDDEGTSVEIAAEPAKIVSLTPATTETLFALGVGDRVVGKVEDFALYPPEAASIPDVAKFGSVDVERIVDLETDLVIAGGNNFNPPDEIVRLRTLGVPVVVVYAPDVETAFADIELIGRAVGKSAEATAVVDELRDGFAAVGAATKDLPKPRVFYELDATNGYFGPAPDYFGTEMIRIAGGEPLTSGTPGVFQIPAETIVEFDPEVILLGDAAYGVTSEQVAVRPGWDGIAAVKSGAIRPVDDIVITRPGPRLAEGLRALATAIHPDLVLP